MNEKNETISFFKTGVSHLGSLFKTVSSQKYFFHPETSYHALSVNMYYFCKGLGTIITALLY